MTITRYMTVSGAALALLVAGCGDDDKSSDKDAPAKAPAQQQSTASQPPAETAPADDPAVDAGGEDAVKQVILDYTFKGDCDTMTDKFLETQAFIGETRKERCDYFEKTFSKPQYKESDVKFRKVEINGDKASVVIGSDIANVETEYTMVAEGGQWRIDEFDLL